MTSVSPIGFDRGFIRKNFRPLLAFVAGGSFDEWSKIALLRMVNP